MSAGVGMGIGSVKVKPNRSEPAEPKLSVRFVHLGSLQKPNRSFRFSFGVPQNLTWNVRFNKFACLACSTRRCLAIRSRQTQGDSLGGGEVLVRWTPDG